MNRVREATIAMLRTRHPGADFTRAEDLPAVLRDLGETWRRIAIQSIDTPARQFALTASAEYVEALADLIDRDLTSSAEAEAEAWQSDPAELIRRTVAVGDDVVFRGVTPDGIGSVRGTVVRLGDMLRVHTAYGTMHVRPEDVTLHVKGGE